MTGPRGNPDHPAHGSDRRGSSRFPFWEDVRYRVLNAKSQHMGGQGRTTDMSSGGLRFTTAGELEHGNLIELSVNWPARLGGVCPLQFVAVGRVVRSDSDSAAVRIQKYEFKTRKTMA
jgi:hypothetical protein